MQKTVTSGEKIATVVLEGDECEVIFSAAYNVFEISNRSGSTVLMALKSGASEGDDGTVAVQDGTSFSYKHMRSLDRLYLTGTGTVIVVASNDTNSSFSRSAKGGDFSDSSDTDKEKTNAVTQLDLEAFIDESAVITDLTEVEINDI